MINKVTMEIRVVLKNGIQRKSICDGRIFVERPARTNAPLKIFLEDNVCSLIINVKPELKLSRDLLPIDLPSSPAIANTMLPAVFVLN